ncbi:MAG: winged helix-turn-helix domain-containing protein [Candidatus Thiodiazotropha sp. LLP2]
MAIPKYDELMPAALEYLADNGLTRYRDLEAPLAQRFDLTEQEVSKEYESGNGTICSRSHAPAWECIRQVE